MFTESPEGMIRVKRACDILLRNAKVLLGGYREQFEQLILVAR
jgi:hypothetical protein